MCSDGVTHSVGNLPPTSIFRRADVTHRGQKVRNLGARSPPPQFPHSILKVVCSLPQILQQAEALEESNYLVLGILDTKRLITWGLKRQTQKGKDLGMYSYPVHIPHWNGSLVKDKTGLGRLSSIFFLLWRIWKYLSDASVLALGMRYTEKQFWQIFPHPSCIPHMLETMLLEEDPWKVSTSKPHWLQSLCLSLPSWNQ